MIGLIAAMHLPQRLHGSLALLLDVEPLQVQRDNSPLFATPPYACLPA